MIYTHIIAGHFKNSRILLPNKNITRPTMNHIRESVFNILEHRLLMNGLKGVKCLDAFSGSGSLGLEALSRGASMGVFIESNKDAFHILCKNFKSIIKENPQNFCYNKSIFHYESAESFDLVFLDPPFGNNDLYHRVIDYLKIKKMIHSQTIIYVESQKDAPFFEEKYILDARFYGAIKVQFVQIIE